MESIENTTYHKQVNSKSPDHSEIITGKDKALENHFMLRLHEMEELNIHLEKLLDQRTKELTEVVATNTKFISIIAHDLRSPFSTILGVLEILKKSLNDFDINEINKYIDIASKSAISTLNLLDNLLAWTISQNKEKCFHPVKINLNDLLKDEFEIFNTTAIQKQITLNHSIASNLNVTADLQMVKTLLRNLIDNAIKYTNTGGEINISASERNQFIEIEVKDSGIGISNEVRKELLKIDAIHSTSGTINEKGTGLGLILCKEFVEMHGGNMQIESEPGKGSNFKFTLPHNL